MKPHSSTTSTYNLTFLMDGQLLSQTYTHKSDSTNNFQYNTSVLSLVKLAPVSHTFVMMAASTEVDSTLQFDYARYVYVNYIILNNLYYVPDPSYKLLLVHQYRLQT